MNLAVREDVLSAKRRLPMPGDLGHNDCPGDEERCVYCGECKGPDAFEDGLRCKTCAEEQDTVGAESDRTLRGQGGA
jgi:hypothetical protein